MLLSNKSNSFSESFFSFSSIFSSDLEGAYLFSIFFKSSSISLFIWSLSIINFFTSGWDSDLKPLRSSLRSFSSSGVDFVKLICFVISSIKSSDVSVTTPDLLSDGGSNMVNASFAAFCLSSFVLLVTTASPAPPLITFFSLFSIL